VRRLTEVDLMGGNPALDFVDTVGGLRGAEPQPEDELLREYDDLVVLGLKTGALSERAARRLRRTAAERPDEAEAVLARAREKRELIDAVFRPLSEDTEPPAEVLAELRDFGAEAIARGEFVPAASASPRGRPVPAPGGFAWSWDHRDELDAPLWPIAHAAVELLTDGPLDRIKTCGRCRWLFLDTTKNHSRRWCSTEGCGTDEKKERYVARRRARRDKSSSG
jgi:predicted RNA-binding Zn ribbon-like protein